MKAAVLLLAAATVLADDAKPPAGPLGAEESLRRFVVPDDLAIEQVLAEPIVRQPVFITFDEKGRLWVVQYLQYPSPAGLKMVSHDAYWRAVYDKVPPPPPRHFPGRDKITIHEDTDGDGTFDRHKTFVDGLNIATAVARGRGGVWVLNPPYLLFYPDRDNDDVPDGDPEVHLEGFGLEDTHSVVNSLCWGPDGWLYAAQGSTVTGDVKRPGKDQTGVRSMGQLIWRFRPEDRRYEVFAEGGGNALGVEIDAKGRVYSGHNGGDTRGFHYVQGGSYRKGFSKHGPLSNPYAFGFFEAMRHDAVPRFTHTFLIYEGDALPEPYRGKLFGVAPLLSHVVLSEVRPDGSSFQTRDVGHPVTSSDPWFRPVDIKLGPDGAIYIADWYDGQVNHYRNHEGQIDPSNGRIYRLKAKGERSAASPDMSRWTTAQLLTALGDPNPWRARTALRLLGDRKDATAVGLLRETIDRSTGQVALNALWALHLSGGLNDAEALKTLEHPDPYVRLWTVRLLGDEDHVSPTIATRLVALAQSESHVEVRSQLACSARRLPAADGLPIARNLLGRAEDVGDIHLPLLLWWAVESKADSDRDAVLALFDDASTWDLPIVRAHITGRLMRRYAAPGTRKDLLTCARLLRMAPGPDHARLLIAGFEQAFEGRTLANLPDELIEALSRHGGGSVVLGLRQGRPEAVEAALRTVADEAADQGERLRLIQALGEVHPPGGLPVLRAVVERSPVDALRIAALTALQPYDDPAIGPAVVAAYNGLSEDGRASAQTLLASRPAWSLPLLEAIDAGRIDRRSIPTEVVRKIRLHRGERVAAIIDRLWGPDRVATTAEMQAQIDRLATSLRSDPGDPYRGKVLFTTHCAKCHTLFGQGGNVGPDLTPYRRDDVDTLLLSVVNPGAEIREGFENFVVATADGRTLSGFRADEDPKVVVLRGPDGQDLVIPRDEIEEMRAVPASIMPEGLLAPLTDQEVRDLFAYLRSTQPLNN